MQTRYTVKGNAEGNLINGGEVAIQDGWIYYIIQGGLIHLGNTIYRNPESELYRVRTDGTGNVKIADGDFLSINVVGDWVYGIDLNENIRRVHINGGVAENISDEKIANFDSYWRFDEGISMIVVDDWIYYTDGDNNHLFKMQIDGSKKTKLNNEYSLIIGVSGEWVYYHASDMRIYRIRTDGIENQKINDDYSIRGLLSGEWIYYYCYDDIEDVWDADEWLTAYKGFYRVRVDGTDRERIIDNLFLFSSFNIADDWVYYSNDNDEDRLYRMRTNGTDIEKIHDDTVYRIHIIDNWVYYRNINDEGKLYRIQINGTNRAVVG